MPSALKDRFGERLKENESLARHVNFRLGGPARFWLAAKTSDEIAEAVRAAREDGLKWVMLGGGSNVLPSDKGFDGLVIQAANRGWSVTGTDARAEAGVPSAFLARKTAGAGLAGFEWAVSLPGTVGGAVRGNAGCFGGEMSDVVREVEVLRVETGKVETVPNRDCRFGYRDSIFKRSPDIILSATLELEQDDPDSCMKRLGEALSKRKAEQPQSEACAGCLFKNFEYDDGAAVAMLREKEDVPEAFLKARRIPAGWLIDRAGLKGECVGRACVSEKHGNFLVSEGATADQVVQLISRIKTRVRNEYGIQLEEEVQYLGF